VRDNLKEVLALVGDKAEDDPNRMRTIVRPALIANGDHQLVRFL